MALDHAGVGRGGHDDVGAAGVGDEGGLGGAARGFGLVTKAQFHRPDADLAEIHCAAVGTSVVDVAELFWRQMKFRDFDEDAGGCLPGNEKNALWCVCSGCNGAACHAQMYTMGTLLRHGSAAQKARWLPAIASGELRLQAFGVTEPTSGTDTTALKTTARREGNDAYVVNGQKIWTSRAEHSDLMLLLARTTPLESP